VARFEPERESRQRVARLDAQLVGTRERAGAIAAHAGQTLRHLARAQELAARAHRTRGEFHEDGERFRAPRGDHGAALQHVDPGLGGHLHPHLARAQRAASRVAIGLAGDRDEAEIAHRRRHRPRVALDHGDLEAAARRGERMGEADDARAHHDEIERCHDAMIALGYHGLLPPSLSSR